MVGLREMLGVGCASGAWSAKKEGVTLTRHAPAPPHLRPRASLSAASSPAASPPRSPPPLGTPVAMNIAPGAASGAPAPATPSLSRCPLTSARLPPWLVDRPDLWFPASSPCPFRLSRVRGGGGWGRVVLTAFSKLRPSSSLRSGLSPLLAHSALSCPP